jgi:hypothetical protein
LRYVGFIKDENVKIQRFMSRLPSFYNGKIQFDEPRTLEEAIRKEKYLYEQIKRRTTFQRARDDKKIGKIDHRKKGLKPPFFRINSQSYRQGKQTHNEPRKQPIKCWG